MTGEPVHLAEAAVSVSGLSELAVISPVMAEGERRRALSRTYHCPPPLIYRHRVMREMLKDLQMSLSGVVLSA